VETERDLYWRKDVARQLGVLVMAMRDGDNESWRYKGRWRVCGGSTRVGKKAAGKRKERVREREREQGPMLKTDQFTIKCTISTSLLSFTKEQKDATMSNLLIRHGPVRNQQVLCGCGCNYSSPDKMQVPVHVPTYLASD